MDIKLITTTEEFYKLKEPWERLQQMDKDVTYYSTFEYNWIWWNVYKNENIRQLFIVAVKENGQVIAIAPFVIKKVNEKLFSYKLLEFLGTGDYLGILLDRNCEIKSDTIIKKIFNFVESESRQFERIKLTHIKADSKLSAYMLKNKKHNMDFKYLIECPILRFNRFKSFQDYKKEFASSNAKQYSNKLQRKVDYSFRVICNENEDVYDRISKLHINEQNYLIEAKGRKGRSSLYEDEFHSEFVKNIFNHNSNVITFVIEDKNGNILIYETCYLYKRILHMWNTAYDPSYEKYNLGKIINLKIAEYLFENNMADIFDFGAGRYFWKFEWADDFMLDYELDMWNVKTLKGRILKKLYKLKKRYFRRKNG
ncbi:GNAT family N-acetyltransferase [Clostridium sp. JN-9]|uniref:GNAT family N-acetyltransferase n=1 Tax=Clostridium sp. JN-9 TaxID=2507159 RepID=UPI000FFE1A4C|nr:GNAT family N-acetyltransferase [Clostridium sp. JN-9]QAT40500.1 GNAT family N-acetyltransferase [Clostridium sp. JN-9]